MQGAGTLICLVGVGTGFNTAGLMLGGAAVFCAVALDAGMDAVLVMGIFFVFAFPQHICPCTGFDAFQLMVSDVLGAGSVNRITGFNTGSGMEIGFADSAAGTGLDASGIMRAGAVTAAVVMAILGTLR